MVEFEPKLSASKAIASSGALFDSDATNVPEPSSSATITALSTSTTPVRSLVPLPGVYSRSVA